MIMKSLSSKILFSVGCSLFFCSAIFAQGYKNVSFSTVNAVAGIEVGSKGVKMSILKIDKNAASQTGFTIVKDTSANTDFISFSQPTFNNTIKEFASFYMLAKNVYMIPTEKIFTVISSGVKNQAEKERKVSWVRNLLDSFRTAINEPNRNVVVIDVFQEAMLSHLGIVKESRRYSTFLIDIGSGNTKGGYFPYGNAYDFKLFNLNWGTKSTVNNTLKRCTEDSSLANFNKQLGRVLYAAENTDIAFAVNASGAFHLNDYITMSGGCCWAMMNLIHPEQPDNMFVTVTYEEVENFTNKIFTNYADYSEAALLKNLKVDKFKKKQISDNIKSVYKVFDQRALMAGSGLLLKIMRQFKSTYETKQFDLVRNGQVGWISAYVNQQMSSN
jgi:hypothetical protein